MKHVVAIRRALGVPTLFNLLGPLCNPAGATHQLLGTSSVDSQRKIAAALQSLGTTRSAVIRGDDGQDEVTLDGATEVVEISGGEQRLHRWTSEAFGLPAWPASRLQANDPAESAIIIRQILDGQKGPARDVVVAGAAAAIWLVGKSDGLLGGVAIVQEAIDSGAAKSKLDELIRAGENGPLI